MRILSNDILHSLLPFETIIDAVEDAMVAFERSPALAPQRMHLDMGDNTLLVMPAFSDTHYGTKLVSVIPGNKELTLPVTNGAMLLNDSQTGLPVAMLNAAKLTALRTGALGAIGLKYTTPEDTDSIGIIGTGAQGIHQALFAPIVRPIKTLYCLKRSVVGFHRLQGAFEAQYPGIPVVPCSSTEALLEKTNTIIAATTSTEPVLPDKPALLRNKHFISIGSYKPSMQELPNSVYALAGHIIMDSPAAQHETGDIINPVHHNLVQDHAVFSMGKVIIGMLHVDTTKTTAYKSAGMALFDLFVAKKMFRAAVKQDKGSEIVL